MTTETEFAYLAQLHALGDDPIPDVVQRLAGDDTPALEWRNELGGLTFRIGDRFVKWNPRTTGIDLARERDRLEWLAGRHPAPRVVEFGGGRRRPVARHDRDAGGCAVGDEWRARRPEAIAAIARGLRAIHAIPIADFPEGWTEAVWVGRRPASIGPRPPILDPVLVHGDACAPNTLIAAEAPGRATSTSATWPSATAGRTSRSRRSASTGTSARVTSRSCSTRTGSSPTRSGSRWYRALWDLES